MFLVYVLLTIIAIGVLLISEAGREILRWISNFIGMVGIICLVCLVLGFLIWFLYWFFTLDSIKEWFSKSGRVLCGVFVIVMLKGIAEACKKDPSKPKVLEDKTVHSKEEKNNKDEWWTL